MEQSASVESEVPHRDAEVQTILEVLSGIPEPNSHDSVTIFGPPGSGKTTLGKHTMNALLEKYPQLEAIYVDCTIASTEMAVLEELTDGISEIPNIPSSTRKNHYKQIREVAEPILVILDEIQYLEEYRILRPLFEFTGVWTICIGHDEEQLKQELDPGIQSLVSSAWRIQLERYTVGILTDILAHHQERNFPTLQFSIETLERIARAAEGDARYAISMMRQIGQRNRDRNQSLRYSSEELLSNTSNSPNDQAVSHLASHPRLLYHLISDEGSVRADKLKVLYTKRAKEPRSDRSRQYYLTQLRKAGLIEKTGTGRGARYTITET